MGARQSRRHCRQDLCRPGVSADAMAKMRAEKSNPKHHIMMMDGAHRRASQTRRSRDSAGQEVMSNLADIFPSYIVEDGYGVGWKRADGLAFTPKPPNRLPGRISGSPISRAKVSPPAFTTTNGVVFWVMAGAIKSGKSVQDAQRGPRCVFRRMKDLKPNIHSFWSNDAQQFQLMQHRRIVVHGCREPKAHSRIRPKD